MAQKKSIDDQTVLEKALLVISEQGPEKFTLADVGKAVGLAPATLMQRFGSKQQLLILAAKQANVKLRSDLEELKKKKLPWDQELIHLLSGVPKGFGSRQDIANSLGVLKLDMIDPELHPIARHLFESLRQRIQELIQEGQSSEQLDSSFDVNVITWELDALRHGLVIQWTLSGKGTLQKWLENGFNHYFKRVKK
jgi:AcrR family transcriptional regulator